MHTYRISSKHCLAFGLGLALAVLASHGAKADPITYTEQATATGSLGANNFTNALITFTFVGDTANVTGSPGDFSISTGTATIDGIGTATFTGTMDVFDNQGAQAAGIGEYLGGSVLDTYDAAFSTYDLTTAIGPITGQSYIRPDLTFGTTAGGLNLQSAGNSTFTATLSSTTATPEPAGMLPTALGMLGLGGLVLTARKRIVVRA